MQGLVLLSLAILAKFSFGKPLSTDDALASFRLESEDLRIELVAAEPEVVDPVALCFDSEVRLFAIVFLEVTLLRYNSEALPNPFVFFNFS